MGSLKKNRKKRPGSGLQKHKRSIVAITAVIILLCGMVIVHGMALKKSSNVRKALGRKYPEAFFIHRNLEGGGKWRLNTERSK